MGQPDLRQQRRRFGRVGLRRADIGVFGVHRADMMVLGGRAEAVMADGEHGGVVDGALDRAAHARVVIGRLVDAHPRDDGVAGHLLAARQAERVERRDEARDGLVVEVDQAVPEGRDLRRRVGAEIDPLDGVERRRAAPPALAAHHAGEGAGLQRFERKGAEADRVGREVAALRVEVAMHDQGRIIGHAGDQGDVGARQGEAHMMVADALDGPPRAA
jgi:hypothetical protein